jgi:hypothetical protein
MLLSQLKGLGGGTIVDNWRDENHDKENEKVLDIDSFESESLQETLRKMADLLCIGFGDAGVGIIKRHLD